MYCHRTGHEILLSAQTYTEKKNIFILFFSCKWTVDLLFWYSDLFFSSPKVDLWVYTYIFYERPLKMNDKCKGQAINGNTWHLLQRFKIMRQKKHLKHWLGVTLQKEKSKIWWSLFKPFGPFEMKKENACRNQAYIDYSTFWAITRHTNIRAIGLVHHTM